MLLDSEQHPGQLKDNVCFRGHHPPCTSSRAGASALCSSTRLRPPVVRTRWVALHPGLHLEPALCGCQCLTESAFCGPISSAGVCALLTHLLDSVSLRVLQVPTS